MGVNFLLFTSIVASVLVFIARFLEEAVRWHPHFDCVQSGEEDCDSLKPFGEIPPLRDLFRHLTICVAMLIAYEWVKRRR